jgi:hypothetical protein
MIERGIYEFKKTSDGRKKYFLWLYWNPKIPALRSRLTPASEGPYAHAPEESGEGRYQFQGRDESGV